MVPAPRQPPQCRGRDDHQAHRLVEDHRLQGEEAEDADEERQAELGTPQADEAAESPTQAPAKKPAFNDRGRVCGPSQARVDGLALQRQHAEHALVHPVERLPAHEALERLDPQPELADRE